MCWPARGYFWVRSRMSLISGMLGDRFLSGSGGMPERALVAIGVTLVLAGLARGIRAVNTGGAVAGALLTLIITLTAGIRSFAGIAAVFVLAWVSTRFDYESKRQLGTAERPTGRSASQIAANLGTAAAAGVLSVVTRWNGGFLVAMVAALAEAAADTVSSECGQALSIEARLITTWERVPAGMDGAISAPGTLAGLAGAGVVAAACALAGIVGPRAAAWAGTGAVVGMLADSYLGAALQRRGVINNDAVNFLSTMIAAAVGFAAAQW
jgi:uncharacterized protein (TIGR00297 family)